MLNTIPPFVIFYIGAVLVAVSRGYLRNTIMVAIPVIAGYLLLTHTASNTPADIVQIQLFEYQLTPFRIDKLSLIFAYLFVLVALIGNIYALHVKDTIQQVASMVYSGSALGAIFAGDLLSLFLFWETLAISSVILIWAQASSKSFHTGLRYLIVQVLSGVLLLAGTLFIFTEQGSLNFQTISLEGLGAWLIFIAFGIKCAFPLLHHWLTDAYPEATPTGTVFLSAFSTKVAVYALARAFSGTEILIEIGAVMALFPIVYALLDNDLRRVLAYLMITQIGIMVIGIGIGTELAINGAVAHVFIHVIYKSLLFMTMGTVLWSTGYSKATELGGLYKTLPKTAALCLFGTLFLLFSSLISKALVMQAAITSQHPNIWLILLASAAGVFMAALKVPFFAFFAKDAGLKAQTPPRNMMIAMYLSIALCILLAAFPQVLYSLLPYPVNFWPYEFSHILTYLELFCFATLVFIGLYQIGHWPTLVVSIHLDADWFYRKPFKQLVLCLTRATRQLYNNLKTSMAQLSSAGVHWLIPLISINGIFERMPPSSITITIILSIFTLTLAVFVLL